VDDGGLRPAVARVMGPVGVPVGAAFLVTPNLLLTAAHVVSLAAGNGKHGTARPDAEVMLNFAVAPDLFLRAELVHWVPPGDVTPEDIAGLRLVDPVPDGARPAPLTDLLAPLGRQVVTLGFPRDAPHGGWGRGQLADADGRALVQVDTVPDSQFTIEEGFSGTPVWDIQDRAVAGLIVEGWTRGRRSGFMIPTSMLLAGWPGLAEQVWPGSPFRGLKSFTEHDSAVYFGRDELVDRIAELSTRSPALTVIGASGVGKLDHPGDLGGRWFWEGSTAWRGPASIRLS
jgi:conflict system STAND superfamily ATPase/trypsin-like peptidase